METNDDISCSKVLIYGHNGWIGSQLIDIIRESELKLHFIRGKARLENYEDVKNELDFYIPNFVLCVAGLTGKPNVDWCEDHQDEVLRINVIATSVLADYCFQRNIHLTYFGTGCIYEYSENMPRNGFTEDCIPNFQKSFYSKTKIITEQILKLYDNTLILRIRMPLSNDLHPKNFITKITKYEKVVNVPNSMTILSELLPISLDMMMKKVSGVYNFTNPGVISHNEILDLYTKYIDPTFTYVNFSLNEQSKILKAERSNNCLDSSKLMRLYPHISPIKSGVIKLFERMGKLDFIKEK